MPNALSRKCLDLSKRASVLHCCGYLHRKNRPLFGRGVIRPLQHATSENGSCAAVFGMLRCRFCTATFAFLQRGSHFYQKLRRSKRKTAVHLDGQNRAIVIAESLARVIAAIVGGHIFPQNTGTSPLRPCVRCAAIRIAAIGVHSCSIRSTWNHGMACES